MSVVIFCFRVECRLNKNKTENNKTLTNCTAIRADYPACKKKKRKKKNHSINAFCDASPRRDVSVQLIITVKSVPALNPCLIDHVSMAQRTKLRYLG